MSIKSLQLGQTKTHFLNAALTLTGTPTSGALCAPFGNTVALLQNAKLTEWVSTGEVLRPLGVNVQSTTTITVTSPVFTLQKAANSATANTFASASSGGVATGGLLVAASANYYPFTSYINATTMASNFTTDAAGDVWRVSVTTSPTAGAANLHLHYVNIDVAGISAAVTTL